MAKAKIETGIGYSPLTGRVYLGKQNKSKGLWVGNKKDITSDFIKTVLTMYEIGTTREILGNGEPLAYIIVAAPGQKITVDGKEIKTSKKKSAVKKREAKIK